ncbi:MAG TPA: class I SAM-dependent methyltransferase [Blastocatellia bacterium]|nr:class I SAM-dependent methyltransferase [Blastocatellia bacterium]
MAKVDYGIDAPGVIRNLMLIGAASLTAGYLCQRFAEGGWLWRFRYTFFSIGIVFFAQGCLMLVYAKFGKFRHRDRIIEAAGLHGDERVLDVGTGRGLLAVGAAKKLMGGKVTAIDIWNTADLSGNTRRNTESVVKAEGVADRVSVEEADATKLPFADGTFDVVVSNLCLHNIYSAAGREQAIREITRVLRPAGRAVISDFRHVGDYADYFRRAGIASVETRGPYLLDTFPPLRVVVARKNK